MRTTSLPGVLFTLAALLVSRPSMAQPTAVAGPTVTAADVRFMQEMIGHHAQAVEMTALIQTRTRRPDLQTLGERITVSQRDEIAMMRHWLEARGATVPATMAHDMRGHGASTGHAMALMPGMLTPEQMTALRASRGATFDRLFLEGMIQHHGGALTMVGQLLAVPGAAQESEINRFVTDVDTDQRAEITRMRRMLSVR